MLAHLSELTVGAPPPGHCSLCPGMGKADASQEQAPAGCSSLSCGSSSVSGGAALETMEHTSLKRTWPPAMKGTTLEIRRLQHPSATIVV